MNRKLFVLAAALALTSTLSGCKLFGGGEDRKPKTPVLGQRIAVLTAETGAEVDPTLDQVPVVVPAEVPNAEWPQPGGNGPKSMGNVALGRRSASPGTARSRARAARSGSVRVRWSVPARSSSSTSKPWSMRSI
jgi:hypothetical protein